MNRPRFGMLTAREMEVVRLMASGMSYKRIAQELGVAPSTIRTHISNSLTKLGVDNRVALAVAAIGRGFIETPFPPTKGDAWLGY